MTTDLRARLTDAMAVDRPAPTPTPAPGLDLDAVERAERAMTPGPWHGSGCSFGHGIVQRTGNGSAHGFQDDAPCSFDVGAANAAGIVALRNAAPALIAEVRALREKLAEAKRLGREACGKATHTEQCGKTQADYHHSKGYRGCPGEDEDCTCGLAAIAAALEAL